MRSIGVKKTHGWFGKKKKLQVCNLQYFLVIMHFSDPIADCDDLDIYW